MTDTPFVRYPHAARPRVGLDTAVVMDHAVVALADRRFMVALDAPVQLHLLASLVARAEAWLGEQIAAARSRAFLDDNRTPAGPHRNGGAPALREGAVGALTRTTSTN